ncbi:hypothetical protein GCM10022221_37670 [Actinocorallia aurea]
MPQPGRTVIRNPLLFESDPEVPARLKGKLNRYAELVGREVGRDGAAAAEEEALKAEIRSAWAEQGLDGTYLDAILIVLEYQVVRESLGRLGEHAEYRRRLDDFWMAHGMEKRMLRQIVNRIDLNLLGILDG